MRQSFKPYQQMVEVLREDPGASRKVIVAHAKSAVVQADMQVHFEQCSRWVVQGQTMRQFQDRAAELWAHVVTSLPESSMRFALNSVTYTLPHNANLHLWGKQTSPVCVQSDKPFSMCSTIAALPWRRGATTGGMTTSWPHCTPLSINTFALGIM